MAYNRLTIKLFSEPNRAAIRLMAQDHVAAGHAMDVTPHLVGFGNPEPEQVVGGIGLASESFEAEGEVAGELAVVLWLADHGACHTRW
jgi:hypothetical protein